MNTKIHSSHVFISQWTCLPKTLADSKTVDVWFEGPQLSTLNVLSTSAFIIGVSADYLSRSGCQTNMGQVNVRLKGTKSENDKVNKIPGVFSRIENYIQSQAIWPVGFAPSLYIS